MGILVVYTGFWWGKRPLGRPRLRWEDIKIYFQEVGCEGMFCVDLAQDRYRWWTLVNSEMNLCVP
jgi:hypothetical protein